MTPREPHRVGHPLVEIAAVYLVILLLAIAVVLICTLPEVQP